MKLDAISEATLLRGARQVPDELHDHYFNEVATIETPPLCCTD
jgi:hypothetical protein